MFGMKGSVVFKLAFGIVLSGLLQSPQKAGKQICFTVSARIVVSSAMPYFETQPNSESTDSQARAGFLPSTHWSVILAANGDDTPAANAAMDALFRAYQRPLYAYIRRRGTTHHDAEDLLQAFFGRLVAKGVLRSASQQRGQFRSFLLAS